MSNIDEYNNIYNMYVYNTNIGQCYPVSPMAIKSLRSN